MAKVSVCLLYVLVVVSLSVAYDSWKVQRDEDLKDFITLMQILAKPRVPEKYQVGLGASPNGFTWKNCGQSSDMITVDKLWIGPDKIKLPGNIVMSGSGKVNSDLSSPISLSLKIKKKVFVWVDIPCIDNIGSCEYDDMCDLLSQIQCPTGFDDCQCPYSSGPVSVNNATLYVDATGLPTWLTQGEYQIEAKTMYQGKEAFCVQVEVTLG